MYYNTLRSKKSNDEVCLTIFIHFCKILGGRIFKIKVSHDFIILAKDHQSGCRSINISGI